MDGKGKITISLIRSNCGPDYMSIQVQDDPSHVHFFEAHVGVEDFTHLVAGHGYLDCTFELRGIDLVGMMHEAKQEIIFIKDDMYPQDEALIRVAIEPYEVDGWVGHDRDGTNHHHWVKDRKPPEGKEGHWYRIGFHRYVDPESVPPDESHIQHWETLEARGQR